MLTLDIDGTSADVAGDQWRTAIRYGRDDRRIPALRAVGFDDLDPGDGGGSIAWVDGFRRPKGRAGKCPAPRPPGLLWTRRRSRDDHRRHGSVRLPRPPPLAHSSVAMDRLRAEVVVDHSRDSSVPGLRETAEAIIKDRHLRHVRRGEQADRPPAVGPPISTLATVLAVPGRCWVVCWLASLA